MLIYRTCRCCRRLWNKLLHTVFHILAIPCVAVGFLAVLDFHDLRQDQNGKPAPVPHFYSLHSWMGLVTMGLFALQVCVFESQNPSFEKFTVSFSHTHTIVWLAG